MDVPRLDLNLEENDPNIPCDFVGQNNFKDRLLDYRDNFSFSLLNFNVRSCRKNFPLLLAYLTQLVFNFSLIVLTESWLTIDIDHGFDIPQYNQLNIYRNSHGGGIKVYYHHTFDTQIIDALTYVSDMMEVLTFWLIGGSFKYLICCLYRPPSVNPLHFNDAFENYLSLLPENSKIFHDMNINLFNPQNFNYVDVFITDLISLNFSH